MIILNKLAFHIEFDWILGFSLPRTGSSCVLRLLITFSSLDLLLSQFVLHPWDVRLRHLVKTSCGYSRGITGELIIGKNRVVRFAHILLIYLIPAKLDSWLYRKDISLISKLSRDSRGHLFLGYLRLRLETSLIVEIFNSLCYWSVTTLFLSMISLNLLLIVYCSVHSDLSQLPIFFPLSSVSILKCIINPVLLSLLLHQPLLILLMLPLLRKLKVCHKVLFYCLTLFLVIHKLTHMKSMG